MRDRKLRPWAVGLALILLACTQTVADPTTTTPTTATTETTSTTTSTAPENASPTTSTTVDPWSVEYPLAAETVEDLPEVLSARIGAPEPDPDLAIEGPEDVDRWVSEWLSWFSWVNANPEQGIEVLEHGVIPGSTFYEDTQAALEADLQAGTRLLGYAFRPVEVSGTFDEFFERRELLRLVVVAADEIPSYVVDQDGIVIHVIEPFGGETIIRLVLRYREEEGEWVLESLEVLG